MIRLEMKKCNTILTEKYQHCHLDNEYLTGEEILPLNQKEIIEQNKFACSPHDKAFQKQIKTIEDEGEQQIKALENMGNDQLNLAEKKSLQRI